jgi:hypothetical protein
MKPDMIATLRDIVQIREAMEDDTKRERPLFTLEQRTGMVHILNATLDELLAPYTHGAKSD